MPPDWGYCWPASFRGQASLADLPWWGVFEDEALQRLVKTALAQNRGIKVAAARIEDARAHLGATRLAQLQQVNVGASGDRSRASRIGAATIPPGDRH